MDDAQKAWAAAHVGGLTTISGDDGPITGTITKWKHAPDDTVQGGVLVTFTLTADNITATFTAVPPLSDEQVAAIEEARVAEVERQEQAARDAAVAAAPGELPPTSDRDEILRRFAEVIGADPEALALVLAGKAPLA